MRAFAPLLSALALGACVSVPPPAATPTAATAQDVPVSVARAIEVTRRMEPVAEQICRTQTPDQDCDFEFLVNRDPRSGINAFQTVNPDNGRPVIILTVGLIRSVRNDDELAFVIGHETAHHIAEHIAMQEAAVRAGAQIFGASAQQQGANREQIIAAAQQGALVGFTEFSQRAELEADSLGTIITCRAGFDPIVGARFFSQLPDPGARVFGTHPPNAARVQIVADTARQQCR
ncbi:M48 family metallopeptidase [Rhodobacteraceae bacterium N5(2021)]|uniref:M48 family metallopeptidase n=1 Tax=Gymnodinialimonas phycosphaerae TaxID=2841589 RepID=A0A975YFT4_9RHOB|nr:M48 family metallopeptidase [Gymnodinialimonas phycosphaerae]MBY4895057.1 M48 family metallopeptidase [Gymnodinialimonas phycosphaerae]